MTVNFDPDDAERPHERTEIRCPECGAEPTEESVRQVSLSDLGYLHADTSYECAECGYGGGPDDQWTHGVPVGSSDDSELAEDLQCDKCGGWYLVHRVRSVATGMKLHLKCPECYDFKFTHRDTDGGDRALVGYPQITGELNPDKPYGFSVDNGPTLPGDDDELPDCGEDLCIVHGRGTLACPNDQPPRAE